MVFIDQCLHGWMQLDCVAFTLIFLIVNARFFDMPAQIQGEWGSVEQRKSSLWVRLMCKQAEDGLGTSVLVGTVLVNLSARDNPKVSLSENSSSRIWRQNTDRSNISARHFLLTYSRHPFAENLMGWLCALASGTGEGLSPVRGRRSYWTKICASCLSPAWCACCRGSGSVYLCSCLQGNGKLSSWILPTPQWNPRRGCRPFRLPPLSKTHTCE